MKTEILYGIHPVIEALKAKRRSFFSIYIAKGKTTKWVKTVVELANPLNVTVHYVSASQLKILADTDQHQGVAAKVSPFPITDFNHLMKELDSKHQDLFLLMLDHLVDPQNVGALIRTAHCAGIDGILVPKDRSVPPTTTVSKVSAGALEHIHMAQVTNVVNTIKALKGMGVWMVGLDSGGDESIFSFECPSSVALIIGGEEKGIRPLVKRHCDQLCAIPLSGKVDSLNASVAGGIAMYEMYRQRIEP